MKIGRHEAPEPMTRQNLDTLPHDGSVFSISPVCHTESPVFVAYNPHDGSLTLFCAVCRKLVTKVLVADTGPPTAAEVH